MRFRRTLALSFAIHVLAAALWMAFQKRVEPKKDPVFAEVSLSPPASRSFSKRSVRAKAPGTASTDALARVLPKGGLFGLRGGQQTGSPTQPKKDGFVFADGLDVATEGQYYPFFSQLYRKIDAGLVYPDDLVEANIESDFTIQIEVDRRGVFSGRFVDLPADPSLLVAYASAWLVQALREPLPPSLWARDERVTLVARFKFQLKYFESGDPERRAGGQFKNVFEFARVAQTSPKSMKEVGKFLYRYTPPILPVPGGLVIDVVRVYEMIQNWGKADKFEKHDRRLRVLKERWENTILPQ